MHKFKPGDRVQIISCIDGEPSHVLERVSQEGIIEYISPNFHTMKHGDIPGGVRVDFDDGESWMYRLSDIAAPTPPIFFDLLEALQASNEDAAASSRA